MGVDAAEPRLVLDLIERGELPALARLRQEGSWTRIHSPAHVGSSAVFPTFFTGTEPHCHGVYSGWSWAADRMSVLPLSTERLRPFWGALEDMDTTVGVLDVPYAPHVGLSRGFEVTGWGMVRAGRPRISPPEIAPMVNDDHPCATGRIVPASPHDPGDPAMLASGCVEGATRKGDLAERLLERARPDLAIVVFSEINLAAHDLWHTVEPHHPIYQGLSADGARTRPGLLDVYREVDRQIGRLTDAAGEDTAMVVFSLHGMCPSRGIAAPLLEPVLRELGFARPVLGSGRLAGALGRRALATVKRRAPPALKRIYHRRVPRTTRYRLAAPTMIPVLDWSATRAFALPSDQHGLLRVNLRGREAEGAVACEDYDGICDELRDTLGQLSTEDGRPIVHDVVRADPSGAPPALLPDLIVHWSDAAFDQPVRISDPAIEAWPSVPERTGQHRPEGFCLARGVEHFPRESLEASELHRLLRSACNR